MTGDPRVRRFAPRQATDTLMELVDSDGGPRVTETVELFSLFATACSSSPSCSRCVC